MTKHSTELSLPRLLIRSALRLGFGILLLATTLFLSPESTWTVVE